MTDPVDMHMGGSGETSSKNQEPPFLGTVTESDGGTAIVGVSLFLLLIVGVVAILIGSAVYSYRKREEKSGLNSSEPIEGDSTGMGRTGTSTSFLDYETRKGKEE